MADNFHASAVVLGDRGIVIAGASGAGKTQLALALISHARSFGLFARLVADDQILLSAHDGRLVCAAPATIAGLVEVRGVGPQPVAHSRRRRLSTFWSGWWSGARRNGFRRRRRSRSLGCQVPLLRLAADDWPGGS